MAKQNLSPAMLRALWVAVEDSRGLVDDGQKGVAERTLRALDRRGLLVWRGAVWPGEPEGEGRLYQITTDGLIALALAEDWDHLRGVAKKVGEE